jgi:SAM-dependent methyltransferase
MSFTNDPETIRDQFTTDKMLRIRQQTHELYTVPKVDFVRWVLSCYQWQGDERVLDVGSGPGAYYVPLIEHFPDIEYWAMDFQPGMLENHPARDRVGVANAQYLPFPSASIDVIMANHMLYYVEDIDQTLLEFRRVLKPRGVLMVVTNSVNTMRELQIHMRRAIVLLTPSGAARVQTPPMDSDSFTLEDGLCYLSRHFYSVVRHDLPSSLVFPSIQPVMEYLESIRSSREPQLPANVLWDDVMMIMQQQFTHLFNHWGKLMIDKLSGVLIASDQGGFVRDFIEHHENAES